MNADGSVTIADIGEVVLRFGSAVVKDDDGYFVPGPNYMLLYDLDGGGAITISDIGKAVLDFGTNCPLVETQVAQATLSTAPFRDWSVAQAVGYVGNTQYVSQMGIHAATNNYSTTFNPGTPIGLIYKSSGGNPDQLIGLYYIIPVQDVCDIFLPGQTCSNDEPEGFDGPEDNTDVSSVQRGWHTHDNLCFIPPATVIEFGPNGSHQQCKDAGGIINFETYGYMVHLYNFIPNVDGRFMMWNTQNLP